MGNFLEDIGKGIQEAAPIIGGVGGAIIGGPQGALMGYQLGNAVKGAGGGTSIQDSAGMNQYTDLANQAQARYGQQNEFMTGNVDPKRKQLLDALAAQAVGTAPSIAEAQLKSAFDKSLQQQLALARSSRTGNAGLASRNVGNVAAQQGQNLAQQSAIARLQEQQLAQRGLQDAINSEMGYGNRLLESALGGQKSVADMQNASRAANDKRNEGLLGGVISAIPKISEYFSTPGATVPAYKGGQMQAYAKGGKVKKMADGGAVSSSMDMQAADSLLKTKYPKRTLAQELACGGKARKMFDGGSVNAIQRLLNPQMGQVQTAVMPKGPNGAVPWFDQANEDRRVDLAKRQKKWDDAQSSGIAAGIRAAGFGVNQSARPEENIQERKAWAKNERGNWQAPGSTDEFPDAVFSNGGNVPGKAKKPGDHLQNDTVPAILSPGEIVVPRTVVEQGPVAAAHFVKEASNDESYNADTFHAQKKSFAQMLKSIKDDERKYGKISEILKNKKV